MKKKLPKYSQIYQVNALEEWLNAAYDENGNAVTCERCPCEMKWNPITGIWYCPECENELERPAYFLYIGAQPPGSECLTNCCENYPLCKKDCERYTIDPDDPILG